eukprot:m.81519 g.81519  ORF g.81519 m.81519 type:complete len:106 (+) comp20984_c0_seq2:171-488(+)
MNILRANNKRMGSPVNRVNILAEYAANALEGRDQFTKKLPDADLTAPNKGGFFSMLNKLMFRHQLNRLIGRKTRNFEETIEDTMSESIEEHIGIKIDMSRTPNLD